MKANYFRDNDKEDCIKERGVNCCDLQNLCKMLY